MYPLPPPGGESRSEQHGQADERELGVTGKLGPDPAADVVREVAVAHDPDEIATRLGNSTPWESACAASRFTETMRPDFGVSDLPASDGAASAVR